jgi:hypothetical protein
MVYEAQKWVSTLPHLTEVTADSLLAAIGPIDVFRWLGETLRELRARNVLLPGDPGKKNQRVYLANNPPEPEERCPACGQVIING